MDEMRFHELKDAYVLGALPDDERSEFEAFLAAYPERQAEIDDLGGVARMLAYAPPEHEPPPKLRARVMEVVERESGVPRAVQRQPAPGDRYAGFRDFALAAAAVLLVGLISWNVFLQSEVRGLQGEVDDARARAERAESAGQGTGARTIQLRGSWAEQGARVEVAAVGEDRMVLVAEDLPSVPEDRALQVWVIRDDVPQPSGLFEPSGTMTATAVTRPLREGDTVAVTVEPAGGSDQPTTDPVLATEV